MMNQAYRNKYMQTSVQTTTPAQLLIMLYDGAIRFCKAGISAIEQKDYIEANINLCKVQDIISEFIITLDKDAALSESLLSLYEYFIQRLIESNIRKDPVPAVEVLGYLTELKETWVQASKLANAAGVKHG